MIALMRFLLLTPPFPSPSITWTTCRAIRCSARYFYVVRFVSLVPCNTYPLFMQVMERCIDVLESVTNKVSKDFLAENLYIIRDALHSQCFTRDPVRWVDLPSWILMWTRVCAQNFPMKHEHAHGFGVLFHSLALLCGGFCVDSQKNPHPLCLAGL